MPTKLSKPISLLFIISTLILIGTKTFAESPNNINPVQRANVKTTVEATITPTPTATKALIKPIIKAELVKTRCQTITERVDLKVTRYTDNRTEHVQLYKNLVTRITNLLTKAADSGYDTTKLKADLTVLNDKIKNFDKVHADYITKLGATKSFACGNSEGEFLQALKEAKDSLLTVREAVLDIKAFFQNTIKPDVLALRAQKQEPTVTPTATPSATE
jgi:hypothetical protein